MIGWFSRHKDKHDIIPVIGYETTHVDGATWAEIHTHWLAHQPRCYFKVWRERALLKHDEVEVLTDPSFQLRVEVWGMWDIDDPMVVSYAVELLPTY